MGQPVTVGPIPPGQSDISVMGHHASLHPGPLTNQRAYCGMGPPVIHVQNIILIYRPIRHLRISRAVVYADWPGFAGTLFAPMRQVWLTRF